MTVIIYGQNSPLNGIVSKPFESVSDAEASLRETFYEKSSEPRGGLWLHKAPHQVDPEKVHARIYTLSVVE